MVNPPKNVFGDTLHAIVMTFVSSKDEKWLEMELKRFFHSQVNEIIGKDEHGGFTPLTEELLYKARNSLRHEMREKNNEIIEK